MKPVAALDLSDIVQTLGETEGDPIVIAQVNGARAPTIVWCNAAYVALTGWTAREITGRPLTLAPRGAAAGTDPVAEALLASTPLNRKVHLATRYATPCHAGATLIPCRDGHGVLRFLVCLVRAPAPSQMMALEAQLAERDQRLAAVAASNVGLWSFRPKTGASWFSDTYRTMLGYGVDDLPASFDTWMELLHPDDLVQARDRFLAHVLGESEEYSADFRLYRKDGSWQWIAATGRILERDRDGRPQLICGVHIDLSDRKRIEASLAEAATLARTASEAKLHLISNLSHELRTPLNGVLGLSQLLAQTGLAPDQQELLGGIEQSGRILLSVVTDLVDLAHIRAEDLEIAEEAFDLVECAKALETVHGLEARSKGLDFTLSLAPEVIEAPRRRGDPQRLQRMLNLLLDNAVKFTRQGRVVLGIGVDVQNPQTVLISVADTGPGIPAELQRRVFDGFTQADTRTSRNHGGMGLGLAIARGLVRAMGGDIRVSSREGRGACFTVELALPLVQGERSADDHGASGVSPSTHHPMHRQGATAAAGRSRGCPDNLCQHGPAEGPAHSS